MRGALAFLPLGLLLAACQVFPQVAVDHPVPHAGASSPIARALEFLENTQATAADEGHAAGVWAGGWPMHIHARVGLVHRRMRDVGAGMPAYVHGALCVIRPEHTQALGLEAADVERAGRLRRNVIPYLERFRSTEGDPGAYGWWPVRARAPRGAACQVGRVLASTLRGPQMRGDRAPPTLAALPPAFCPFADLDDTALVLLARLDHAALDGGPAVRRPIAPLFEAWKDDAKADRLRPTWLEAGSGAYLLWMAPAEPGRAPNEVDLIANANVLHALARHGELDTAGADAAQAVILRAVEAGHHRAPDGPSHWYPRRMFHLSVARAHALGPVPGLAPAVDALAEELTASARTTRSGSATWGPVGEEDEAHQTAIAVLTLIHADRGWPLIRAGCRRLQELQDARTGGWPEGVLWWSRTDTGILSRWHAAAQPTALALEALARVRLRAAR